MEAERAFSIMTLFANKLRNPLNDDTAMCNDGATKVSQKINSINLIIYVYIWHIKLPLATLAVISK